jgi:putative nucleotidyltransferase with HDIG domain
MMITREEAVRLLEENIQSVNMKNHSYASEAVMRALARRLGRDEEAWGIAGLLHDIDSEITQADPYTHGPYAAKILGEIVTPEVLDAIVMHALASGETITGLITATSLVYPDKKVTSVKVKSITKRMKEKAFAASVRREVIMECEKIGLPLDDFAEISLTAMQEIGDTIGL